MNLRSELSQRPDKKKELEIVSYIGNDPARFAELVSYMLEGDETISKYASWLFGHCMEKTPWLIRPHLYALVNNLEKPNLNDSVKRSTVRALSGLKDIPEDLQGHLLQHCFDYLLDPKVAVAIQVHAMQNVFNISKNEPDLLRELQMVIEENMPHTTAAYKARGKRILGQIRKILAA